MRVIQGASREPPPIPYSVRQQQLMGGTPSRRVILTQSGVMPSKEYSLRALAESAALYRRIAQRTGQGIYDGTVNRFEECAANTEENAHTLREFLLHVNQAEEKRIENLP